MGSKVRISATITGDSAYEEYLDASSLVWSSSDESIATVDQNGVVTGYSQSYGMFWVPLHLAMDFDLLHHL